METERGARLPATGDAQGAAMESGSPTQRDEHDVQWVLQPRGTSRVRGPQHFQHSVRKGILLSSYEHVLGADGDELRRLFPKGVARLWGATPPVRQKSEKVTALQERRVGDEVLFYSGMKFVAKARILGLLHNRPLAEAVWGVDKNQNTWEHVMALGDIVELNVPAEPILRGLSVRVPLRSLTLVRAEGRRRFLNMVAPSSQPEPTRPATDPTGPEKPVVLGRDDLLRALASLKTHIKEQRPSRHKPITLLWAIGRLAGGKERMVDWETFSSEVAPLLKEFGHPDSRVTPEYPFWHLRSSGLWSIEGVTERGSTPTPSQLASSHARAGLGRDAAKILRRSLARADSIGLLCSTYFDDIDRDKLLDRVGLAGYARASGEIPEGSSGAVTRSSVTSSRPDRDPRLVEHIKGMYEHECQVCGARVETRYSHYSEAAHIRGVGKPHDGPDELSNLLCLCPNHHVEFDRLAIYIDEDWTVRRNSTGNVAFELTRHADHVIDEEHVRYHRGLCGRS